MGLASTGMYVHVFQVYSAYAQMVRLKQKQGVSNLLLVGDTHLWGSLAMNAAQQKIVKVLKTL